MENRKKGVIPVGKWVGLILIIIGTQAVMADGNEPRVVYVAKSKSLWSVALSVKPTGVRMWQAVMALYERNPGAFYDDVNKLKDNVTLVVPSKEVMLSLTEAEALVRFQLLGDQPKTNLDKVTFDTPSNTSVVTKVELSNKKSVMVPNFLMQDSMQELKEDKVQNVNNMNNQDAALVGSSCMTLTCNPQNTPIVDDRGFSDVGDLYVSFGVSKIKNYSLNYEGNPYRTMKYEFQGENGFEVNVGYLWRDGIVFELGYYRGNSELDSSKRYINGFDRSENHNFGKNYANKGNRKTELVSPKVLFSNDIGNKMSIYTGFGVGLYKDIYHASDNVQNTTDSVTVYGGLYQVILGSKLRVTEDVFIDLRVQNKLYSPSTFSGTGVRAEGPSTVEGTLLIGMNL